MTVIASVLVWALLLGGLLGAILAVPMTASVKVLFQRYIWRARIAPQTVGGARQYPMEDSTC
jgi:predicted PurR-regulated permease PerM